MAPPNSVLPPGLRDPSRRSISSPLLKDSQTYTHYSHETSGAFTQLTATINPGYSNPPHHHTLFRETFTCVSGTLTVTVDSQPHTLAPGESAVADIGAIHSLANETDKDVEFTAKLEPGSEGFEKAMYIVHGLAEDGQTDGDGVPRNVVDLAVVAGLMDTTLAGWGFWAARPLLAVLGRAGTGWGVERRLVGKYWES